MVFGSIKNTKEIKCQQQIKKNHPKTLDLDFLHLIWFLYDLFDLVWMHFCVTNCCNKIVSVVAVCIN